MLKGCWQLLDLGFLKLNTDGAIFADIQAIGFRPILRDHNGDALIVTSIKETNFQFLETTKCSTIIRGLQLCLPLSISKLIIESACQLLVQEI